MKKILSIALCAAAVSVFGETTVSLGQVGVTAITNSLKNTIVAISYDDLAGGEGMVYSNLVKTANLTEGDRLVEFRDNKYTGWVLEKSGNVKYWKEVSEIFVDGSGNRITPVSPTADTIRGAVGTGIWLMRQKPTDSSGTPIPFYIYGKPVSTLESQIEAGKWTLVGNPTQEPKTIGVSDGQVKVVDAKEGDQIVAIDGGGVLRYYAFSPKNGWRRNNLGTAEQLPAIGAGLGIWILTAENATISW